MMGRFRMVRALLKRIFEIENATAHKVVAGMALFEVGSGIFWKCWKGAALFELLGWVGALFVMGGLFVLVSLFFLSAFPFREQAIKFFYAVIMVGIVGNLPNSLSSGFGILTDSAACFGVWIMLVIFISSADRRLSPEDRNAPAAGHEGEKCH
ncbi:MAG: hypothetical protein QM796_02615 [Chthoniobacteraceae bacterium]